MRFSKLFLVLIVLLASFLRFYQIDRVPHGLYIDEISSGYNGYTILKSGVDEYGTPFPLFFKAFGEYKMPALIYSMALSMAFFGKTEFAVRLPGLFFGTGTVIVLYFFLKELLELNFSSEKKGSDLLKSEVLDLRSLPLIASGILAVSPWHLQFSRGGFDATIALFLYLLGLTLFLNYLRRKKFYALPVSMLSFVLTAYSYNAFRLLAPLTLFICLAYLYKKAPKIERKKLFLLLGSSLLLLSPVFLFSLTSAGGARFQDTSAFSEYAKMPLVRKIFLYPMVYLSNYLSYLSFPFLFSNGDGIGRHTVRGMGPLFRWELIFLLLGGYQMIKNRSKFAFITFSLLLVTPVTAALTRPSPHLLRSILLVIPLTTITAYGLLYAWNNSKIIIKSIVVVILLFALYEFSYYLHLYYSHYPMITALDWGAENKKVVSEISKYQNKYDHIMVNTNLENIGSYITFYDKDLRYILVGDGWKKPNNWTGNTLYITSGDKKKNVYLNSIPRKNIDNIHFDNLNNDIYAQLWEI